MPVLELTDEQVIALVQQLPEKQKHRMLAAQSLIESLALISADPIFDGYGVTRLW